MKHQSDPSARNPAVPDTSDTPDRSPADMTPDPKHAAPPSSTSTEPAEAETHSFTAGVRLFRGLGRDPLGRTLAVVSALALIALSLFSVNFSSVFFILIGGVLGVAVYLIRKARRGGDAK